MVVERQDSEAVELIEATQATLVPLRTGDGLDASALDHLKDVLRQCSTAWPSRNEIPKLAANVLVDLAAGVDACADLYGDGYAPLVRCASVEIADLVRAAVAA